MVRQTAIIAALLLLLAAFGARGVFFGHQLYHGAAVNLAKEQRDDTWWREAEAKVERGQKGMRLASKLLQPRIISRGNREDKVVALTFDDGPHPAKVEELLDLLNDLDVKATFFVVGMMVERHPELIKMEAAAGHEVEDHSFSHVNLSKLPEQDCETEYMACSDLIYHVLGTHPKFCRPPGGQATPYVMEAAARNHLVTAMWSDDPKDYANPGDDLIIERLMDHVSPGAIILLHEGVDQTMEILPDLVNSLRAQGYTFVTMEQLYANSHPSSRPRTSFGRDASFSRTLR
jgi:peptidoglycan/xylan/chitin deacetylase (PgdA/CDA1 family)